MRCPLRLLTLAFVLAFVGPSLRPRRGRRRSSGRGDLLDVDTHIGTGGPAFRDGRDRQRLPHLRPVPAAPFPGDEDHRGRVPGGAQSPERSPRRGRRKSSSTQHWGSSSTSTRDVSRGPLPSSSPRPRVPDSSYRGRSSLGLPGGSLPGPEDVRVQGPPPYRSRTAERSGVGVAPRRKRRRSGIFGRELFARSDRVRRG